jgi:predicted NAD/FAD-binding protein
VIGSGVAGLTASYILQQEADVTLYEAAGRLGGHADTHQVLDAASRLTQVDTGFIVHNERTYPHLLRLFRELQVATQESEMSMSVRCGGCGLEYAGSRGLGGLFPSAANLTNRRYLRMLGEVLRFHRRAKALLAESGDLDSGESETVDEFLARGRFSEYFQMHFLTPLISAVWSCAPELAGRYPARYLFQFLDHHGMLAVTGSPQWRTVVGGSASYVERAAKHLSGVLTSTAVRSVSRLDSGVGVADDSDGYACFDAAVIATHPNQALAMLGRPTEAELQILGAISYSRNRATLHTDTSALPTSARAQSSWNYYLPSCQAPASAVHVTYDMNRLQRLDSDTRYLVTLNEDGAVAGDAVLDRMVYEHPIFAPESVAALAGLPALNDDRIAFAGAYHGWGFHEDGCRSGVAAARSLGVIW